MAACGVAEDGKMICFSISWFMKCRWKKFNHQLQKLVIFKTTKNPSICTRSKVFNKGRQQPDEHFMFKLKTAQLNKCFRVYCTFSTTMIVKHILYLRFRLHKHWQWWQKSQQIRAQFLNDFETFKVVWIGAVSTFSFTNFFMAFTTPAILLKNLLLSDGKQWNLISPLNFVRFHPRWSFLLLAVFTIATFHHF